MSPTAPAANVADQAPIGIDGKGAKWAKRLGAAAFIFFLVKGLAWLAAPVLLAWWAVN